MRAIKLTALFFLLASPLAAAGSDDAAFRGILKNSSAPSAEIIAHARSFLAEFPESEHIPDVRLLIADNESSPDKALSQYRAVRDKYRYASNRDYAALRIAQIAFLSSRFADCAEDGMSALSMFPKSPYLNDIIMIVLKAYYSMQQYENADALIIKYPIFNASAAPIRNDLSLKLGDQTGSAVWLKNLPSSLYPESALYQAGREFEADSRKNEAFSAYTDCIKKYPRSAEALLSAKRIAPLKKSGAVYVKDYAAVKKQEKTPPRFAPEKDIETESSGPVYAVLIGPFYNLKEAKDLKKEMTLEFGRALIVKQRKEFVIYAGRTHNQEEAVALKIRLAEEFGFNGTIVNLEEEDMREYIYGQ